MGADSGLTTDWISFVNCDFGYVITKSVFSKLRYHIYNIKK